MSSIITFNTLKGGSGKSCMSYVLTRELLNRGYKVLVIDLDSQMNTSKLYDNEYNVDQNICKAIASRDINANIINIEKNLYLIPADIKISLLNNELLNHVQREFILYKLIKTIEVDVDFIIIDTHPDLSLLTINANIISDLIISPITPNSFSYQSIELLSTQWKKFCSDLEIANNLVFLPNNIRHNTKASRDFINNIYSVEDVKVLNSKVPSLEIFNKILLKGDVLENYPNPHKAIAAVKEFTDEILTLCD